MPATDNPVHAKHEGANTLLLHGEKVLAVLIDRRGHDSIGKQDRLTVEWRNDRFTVCRSPRPTVCRSFPRLVLRLVTIGANFRTGKIFERRADGKSRRGGCRQDDPVRALAVPQGPDAESQSARYQSRPENPVCQS